MTLIDNTPKFECCSSYPIYRELPTDLLEALIEDIENPGKYTKLSFVGMSYPFRTVPIRKKIFFVNLTRKSYYVGSEHHSIIRILPQNLSDLQIALSIQLLK